MGGVRATAASGLRDGLSAFGRAVGQAIRQPVDHAVGQPFAGDLVPRRRRGIGQSAGKVADAVP